MPDIETREESSALSTTAELIADEYHDDTKGGEWTPEIRWAVRKAWIAGRDWGRTHPNYSHDMGRRADADRPTWGHGGESEE